MPIASFDRIRYRRHDGGVFLYAFDLIELDGDDLRRDPLAVRKATLASLLRRAAPGSPLHRRAPNVSRVAGNGLPQRMSRALPECSAVACPTPSRTLSPTMQNDERQVSLESILGSGFSCY